MTGPVGGDGGEGEGALVGFCEIGGPSEGGFGIALSPFGGEGLAEDLLFFGRKVGGEGGGFGEGIGVEVGEGFFEGGEAEGGVALWKLGEGLEKGGGALAGPGAEDEIERAGALGGFGLGEKEGEGLVGIAAGEAADEGGVEVEAADVRRDGVVLQPCLGGGGIEGGPAGESGEEEGVSRVGGGEGTE